jgi:hypothetical protein
LLLHYALLAPDVAVDAGAGEHETLNPGNSLAARFLNWRTRRELHPQPSRRQRGALLIELRVQMVGSAGNAPVRHFRLCFLTPDLQSGSRITSLK